MDTNTVNKPLSRSQELNKQAGESWIKAAGIIIVIAVAAFAEIAFIGIISKMFPDNALFRGAAILGAVATGASAVTLIFAKLKWIRAGHQTYVSWIFLFLELCIMGLNLILSFQLSTVGNASHLDGWMQVYYSWVPATPLVAFVGWIGLFMTDRAKGLEDAKRDIFDEVEEMELDHARDRHRVLMGLKHNILHIQTEQIQRETERRTPDIERASAELVAQEIEGLLGMYIPRMLGQREVEGSLQPVKSVAQIASAPVSTTPIKDSDPAKPAIAFPGFLKDWMKHDKEPVQPLQTNAGTGTLRPMRRRPARAARRYKHNMHTLGGSNTSTTPLVPPAPAAPAAPVKRGRGRPKKLPPMQSPAQN